LKISYPNNENQSIYKECKESINNLLSSNNFISIKLFDRTVKMIFNQIENSHIKNNKINDKKIRDDCLNQWEDSREYKKFKEEIKPIYEIAERYNENKTIIFNDIYLKNFLSEFEIKIIPLMSLNKNKKMLCFQMTPLKNRSSRSRITHVKLTGDSQQYDGIFRFEDETEQKIEVTRSNFGKEQGILKEKMRKEGYKIEFNSSSQSVEKAIKAIRKKQNKNKYQDCWLIVNLHNEKFDQEEDIESFLLHYKNYVEKHKEGIDWSKFTSIIFYPAMN